MKKKLFLTILSFLLLFLVGCSSSTNATQSNLELSYHLTKEELDEKLSTAKIGVLTGGIDEIYIREDYPNADVYAFSTNTDILAALDANKIEYGVLAEAQASRSIEENDYKYEYCDSALYSNHVCIALTKGNDELVSKLNQCIEELRNDGTIDALNDKWCIDSDYSPSDIPEVTDKDASVLRVAVDIASEPYSFLYNGEITGFDCEVIKLIASKLNMRIEYQTMSFGSLIPSIVSGKSDIALGLVDTDERKKEVDFTVPYFNGDLVVVSKRANVVTPSFFDNLSKNFTGTFITENRWQLFVSGIGVTVVISICSFILATIVGALLCLMLISKNKALNKIASIYNKIVTGIPILVWLMILYYIVFKSVNLSSIVVAIITFSLQTGAYLSSIFKTGIDSIDKGQEEAAKSLGFNDMQIFKKIILPQAALNIFDLYEGEFVSLVKTTSIVGYIAINDLTKVSDIVRSRTYQAFFPLVATAIIYFVVTYVFIILLNQLRKKINPKLRKIILKGVKMYD